MAPWQTEVAKISQNYVTEIFQYSLAYSRGLKLKLLEGPHYKEKMLRGPQFSRKKAIVGCNLQKST